VTKEGGHGDEAEEAGDTGGAVQSIERSELPERWSVQRKSELVLRLLRGEAPDAVSRESQVPAHELEGWKCIFLEQGTPRAQDPERPEERERTLARARSAS